MYNVLNLELKKMHELFYYIYWKGHDSFHLLSNVFKIKPWKEPSKTLIYNNHQTQKSCSNKKIEVMD
jgi:hypothetical protein